MINKDNEKLIGRLYNCKFRSAASYTKGESEYVINLIDLLNKLFGNMGGSYDDNNISSLIYRVVTHVLPGFSFDKKDSKKEWDYIREENERLITCILGDEYNYALDCLDGESYDLKETVKMLATIFGGNSGMGLLSQFVAYVNDTLIKGQAEM